MPEKRAIITGGAGRLGSALNETLQAHGCQTLALDCSESPGVKSCNLLEDQETLLAHLETFKPDVIFHCAAVISSSRADELMRINPGMLASIVKAMSEAAPDALLVNFSSAAELGLITEEDNPVKEDFICRPVHPYGESKLLQTTMALSLCRQLNLRCLCPRIFNLYGLPGPSGSPLDEWIRQVQMMRENSQPAVLRTGDLSLVRDFIHASEAIRLIIALSESPGAAGLVNVGSGQACLYRDLVEDLRRLSGIDFQLNEDPALFSKGQRIPRVVADISLLKQLSGETPACPRGCNAAGDFVLKLPHPDSAADKNQY